MKLVAATIENFRGFKRPTRIEFANLTGIVGRNDVGKSSILEALDIFFDCGGTSIDRHDLCKDAGDCTEVSVTCIFSDLPESVIIDDAVATSLRDEQLVNADGLLEVKKTWDCSKVKVGKPTVCAMAVHAMLPDGTSPLHLTQAKLREACRSAGVNMENVNQNENPSMRCALRSTLPPPTVVVPVELEKQDAKAVWGAIQKYIPTYALFKADRDSTDGDSEVQAPLKAAVRLAVSAARAELEGVVRQVEQVTRDVANRTLQKLSEMSPDLAAQLIPEFETPKWDSVFKATLNTDRGIPLNKRGSGVRRLILLNFFRAEAERLATESGRPIFYAIEEPETSQHPDNQRMLLRALEELSSLPNVQVIVTTHVPALAGLIPTDSLRLVIESEGGPAVYGGTDGIYGTIAATLGVIADRRLEVLVCVEGPTDVRHLKAISRLYRAEYADLPCLDTDPRIAVIPMGGNTLIEWASQHYLRNAGAREFHVYDRWPLTDATPKYQSACDDINARGCGFKACITQKNEIENYLHADVIGEVTGASIAMRDDLDVEKAVRDSEDRICTKREVKRKLAEAMERMTLTQLRERDPDGETLGWLRDIAGLLSSP